MRHCPNPDCPHRVRFGRASEFVDEIETCRDCDTTLVGGDAPASTRPHAGPVPLSATAFTLLAVVGSLGLARIPLPGVLPPRYLPGETPLISVSMLGLIPFLSASVLVELVAALVPKLRRLRIEGRAKLARAVMLLTLVFAVVQAYGIVTYLQSEMFELALAPPLLMATLVAALFAQVALASLVDRRGVGNGVSTLVAASMLVSTVESVHRAIGSEIVAPAQAALGLGIVAGIVFLTVRMVGQKSGARGVTLRVPLSGIDPVISAASLLLVPVTLSNLGLRMPRVPLVPGTTAHAAIDLSVVLGLTLLLSLLFHRLANVRAAIGAGADAIRAARRRALRPTSIYVLGVAAAGLVLASVAPMGIVASQLTIVTVVVVDAIEEIVARRRAARWVSVASVHRVYALDPILDRLAAARIHAFPRSLRTRALFQFFGPWAPIVVLVAADDEARAREVLA